MFSPRLPGWLTGGLSRGGGSAWLLVAVVALVIGCSGPGTIDGHLSRVSHTGPGSSGQVLPIFAYMPSDAEQNTYDEASNIMEARCMARFGLPDPSPLFVGAATSPMYRRYGVTSMAVAKRWGYHLETASKKGPTPPPRTSAAERKTAFAVLLGTWFNHVKSHLSALNYPRIDIYGKLVPAGGCREWAALRLGSSRHEISDLPQKINFESFEASQNDPTVVAALRAWSICMATHGYAQRNPTLMHLPFKIDSRAPSRAEINLAVTDVRCKDRTHLAATWFAVEYRWQQAAIQRHITVLAALRSYMLRQQRAALAVIGSTR